MSRILGIETSCDETGIAVVEADEDLRRYRILAAEVASQVAIHAQFGGVVPEIASRQHIQCISQLAEDVISAAVQSRHCEESSTKQSPRFLRGIASSRTPRNDGEEEGPSSRTPRNDGEEEGPSSKTPRNDGNEEGPHDDGREGKVAFDAVAATNGPGLMGALLVGVNFAKALAYKWHVPFIPVHHIEGHLFSDFLTENPPEFPFLALVVSGGHTCLIDCPRPHEYHLLGTTRDDAVGECFDKVARLLDLPYPGGPSIQKAAETGNPKAIRFPRGLARSGELEFSYSGLKTAVLYEIRKGSAVSQADMAASFQHAAVDVLITKTKLALEKTGAARLVLAGGVAANKLLRHRLSTELDVPVFLPPLALCLDNGAMIAAAGASRLRHGLTGTLRATPSPNLPLAEVLGESGV